MPDSEIRRPPLPDRAMITAAMSIELRIEEGDDIERVEGAQGGRRRRRSLALGCPRPGLRKARGCRCRTATDWQRHGGRQSPPVDHVDRDTAAPSSIVAKVPAAEEINRITAAATRTYLLDATFYRELADTLAVCRPRATTPRSTP